MSAGVPGQSLKFDVRNYAYGGAVQRGHPFRLRDRPPTPLGDSFAPVSPGLAPLP